jgi:single-strand DNA-binding protein
MASLNKVTLIGNLGKDPEMRHFPNGDLVANTSLATTETWKDKNSGEKKEATEWHNLVFHRRLAEIAAQYLKKGSQIYVEGSIKTRSWEKDGTKHYMTEIIVSEMKMLGGRPEGSTGGSGTRQTSPGGGGSNPARSAPQSNSAPASGGFNDFTDDIPFAPVGRGISGHSI